MIHRLFMALALKQKNVEAEQFVSENIGESCICIEKKDLLCQFYHHDVI
jgi:hypothetical protein